MYLQCVVSWAESLSETSGWCGTGHRGQPGCRPPARQDAEESSKSFIVVPADTMGFRRRRGPLRASV